MTAGGGSDTYDVVVVGSGIGGMAAAALLAKAGQRVLVAEQHAGPGGYAHAFRRGPYTIDPAVHSITDPKLFDALLRHLDVREHCELLPVDRFYNAIGPGQRYQVPLTTPEEFVEAHVRWFPQDEKAVRGFFGLCRQIHREAHNLPQRVPLHELDAVARQFPTLFRYRNALLGDALAEFFTDPRTRTVCAAISALLGLPPSRVPFQAFAQLLSSYLVEGMFYCRGGAEEIIKALAVALRRDRGTLLVGSRVSRVLIEGGRAVGVELADGRRFFAPVVISNAAAPLTFEEMVGPEHLPPPFLRKLRRMKPSGSAFILYAATRQDLPALGADHTNLFFSTWELEESIGLDPARGRVMGMGVFVPTAVDPSLAPPGEHVLTCLVVAPYDIGRPWAEAKADYRAAILREMDALFPGFTDQLLFSDTATPLTMERYSLNTRGAIYGWENTLDHAGSKRPAPITPVPGLYLAGHWTQPGAGWLRAGVSGMITSRLVLTHSGLAGVGRPFEHASLPPAE